MYITYKGNRVKVPLEIGAGDRHITIVTLNEILKPDFEVRFCIDSNGADTLAFLPLACDVWRELEAEYGAAVAKRFYKLQMKPCLLTRCRSDTYNNVRGITRRCTGAGYLFGFSTSFPSFKIIGCSTITRVGPPAR